MQLFIFKLRQEKRFIMRKTNRFWLPQYTIEKDEVIFLNKYHTGIRVNGRLNNYIRDGLITADLEEVISLETIQQLLANGIIIPWEPKLKHSNKINKKRGLVIQPHSDDAAFSCGGTIQYLIEEKDMEIDLLTIFSHQKYSGSPWSKYFDLDDLSYQNIRKSEDGLLSRYIGCNLNYLDYEDASARSRLSVISKSGLLRQDMNIKALLKNDLSNYLIDYDPQLVLFPFSIGLHRDHLTVHVACMELLKELLLSCDIYMYEDYPYCNTSRYAYSSRVYEVSSLEKIQTIYINIQNYLLTKAISYNFYRSQLINHSFKQIQEEVNNTALSVVFEGRIQKDIKTDGLTYAERLWRVNH